MKEINKHLIAPAVFCLCLLWGEMPISMGEETSKKSALSSYEHIKNVQLSITNKANITIKSGIILNELQNELDNPTPNRRENSYLTNTEYLQLQYIHMLVDLGTNVLPLLKEFQNSGDGRISTLLSSARAMLGDNIVFENLTHSAQTENDPFTKAMAIRGIGYTGRQEAVPILTEFLKDSYFRQTQDCSKTYDMYLIREEAAGALRRLGVDIERDGFDFRIKQ